MRGAARDRHGRGAGCDGRDGAQDEAHSLADGEGRVVLTPRRWRQVARRYPRGDGDNKARSPRIARRKPFKTHCAGNAGCSGEPVVTTVCYLHYAHGLRVQRAPGVSCALVLQGRHDVHANLGRVAPRERGVVAAISISNSSCREGRMDCFGARAPRNDERLFEIGSRQPVSVKSKPPLYETPQRGGSE